MAVIIHNIREQILDRLKIDVASTGSATGTKQKIMITKQDKAMAVWALDECRRQGAQGARINIYGGSGSSYELRDLRIDKIQQSSERSMVIHLFVDGRYGSYSTNRLDKSELKGFIKQGVENTRYLAQDPFRTLPDPSRYYKGASADLKLFDSRFEQISPEEKIALARRAGEEIAGKDARILSQSTAFGDSSEFSYQIDSQGFEGERSSTQFSLVASVSVKDEGDARPENYWYDVALFFDTLKKEGVGQKALERTLRKLGARKIASGEYNMLVDNLSVGKLLSPVISAMNGSALQQRNSFLINQLNRQLFAPTMSLMDDPHCESTPGARFFDGEGIATAKRAVIEAGYLRTYYIDTYSGNKMGVAPTISAPSTLFMNMGDKDLDGLVASVDKGILVTGFNGGNCNSTTGDFSYGVEGFWVENGKRQYPISEMNITGNMLTLWQSLAEIGNDPLDSGTWKIPSLLFEKVNFSGL